MGPSRHRSAGFTLIELLVSTAIITVVIGTALMALKHARRGAERVQTLNALRQIMTAYSGYSGEHNGRLLPGYINPTMLDDQFDDPNKLDIKAYSPTGHKLSIKDTASYVWRLAPYLDNVWSTYMTDYRSKELDAGFSREFGDGVPEMGTGVFGPGTYDPAGDPPELGIGIATSIGLNSIYIGGDSFHGP